MYQVQELNSNDLRPVSNAGLYIALRISTINC